MSFLSIHTHIPHISSGFRNGKLVCSRCYKIYSWNELSGWVESQFRRWGANMSVRFVSSLLFKWQKVVLYLLLHSNRQRDQIGTVETGECSVLKLTLRVVKISLQETYTKLKLFYEPCFTRRKTTAYQILTA